MRLEGKIALVTVSSQGIGQGNEIYRYKGEEFGDMAMNR